MLTASSSGSSLGISGRHTVKRLPIPDSLFTFTVPPNLAAIRATNYGLTIGVQTRLESFWQQVFAGTSIGNTYVNRNMIGAVVGVQPFGGNGLSGTGPKAGGPHYLSRFANERTLTVNTTATGGNAALLNLGN